MLKRLLRYFSSANAGSLLRRRQSLVIVPANEHHIRRQDISRGGRQVLDQLTQAGYEAHIVGGGVRDLLLGVKPKDFDVATNALPEEIRGLFRGSRIIGRRFRLVHVRQGREIVEVATFRGSHGKSSGQHEANASDTGMILRDNVFGTIEEDAIRRDFTINALYLAGKDLSIHDYTGGLKDIEKRRIRLIGDPETRYREDPVRMLRAIRLSTKLDLSIDSGCAKPIAGLGFLLESIPPARLFDEVIKLFMGGHALPTLKQLEAHGLFQILFPDTAEALEKGGPAWQKLIETALLNTDERVRSGKPVTPAFLFAALLWPAQQASLIALRQQGISPGLAFEQAASETTARQVRRITLPKRYSIPMREIWALQYRLDRRQGDRAWRLMENPRFRAAYDFLLLREQSGERTRGLGQWWTSFQAADETGQQSMLKALAQPGKRRRKRGHRKRPGNPAAQ